MKPFLKGVNVYKEYRLGPGIEIRVLKGASITINRGEFVAVMGSSGSGKSTLLHVLGALDRPTDGEVFFEQQSLFRRSNADLDRLRCRSFGFVFQFYHLLPELNVFENALFPQMIRYSASEWLKHGSEAKNRCRQILERVGLVERLSHRPNQLSGGERQRVAIARALANYPAILLADEPTGNLDKRTGQEVMSVLADVHRGGQTIIMVTHDPQVAAVADRTVMLEDGKLHDTG